MTERVVTALCSHCKTRSLVPNEVQELMALSCPKCGGALDDLEIRLESRSVMRRLNEQLPVVRWEQNGTMPPDYYKQSEKDLRYRMLAGLHNWRTE